MVTSDSLNYKQRLFSHPDYKFEPQNSNTYGQTISLGANITPVVINIPNVVHNWAYTNLLFQVVIPASAAGNPYTWIYQQCLSAISQIQHYAGSGQMIADINNLQNYLDIVVKKETLASDFLSLDPSVGTYANNSLANMVPALRNATILNTNPAGAGANPSSVNYMEPAYFTVTAAQTIGTYNVNFPMRLIKNSIFSIDKDLYYGQITYLKLYFGPISKVCYSSTSSASPSVGAKVSFNGAAASIANLQLMLAQETNENIVTMLTNKVLTTGLSFDIPYVVAFKNSNNGTTQTINMNFDANSGRFLMKVYHAVYNNNEDQDTAYDHSNCDLNLGQGAVAAVGNQKVQSYYTQLNAKRYQDITMDCTANGNSGLGYTDYMQNKRQLIRTVISNRNIYQYNWFHCDDFCQFQQYDQENKGELISGIQMGGLPVSWSFYGATMTNAQYQHYTWAVFLKRLTMTAGIVTVN